MLGKGNSYRRTNVRRVRKERRSRATVFIAVGGFLICTAGAVFIWVESITG